MIFVDVLSNVYRCSLMLPLKKHVMFAIVSFLSKKMLSDILSQGGMFFISKDLKHRKKKSAIFDTTISVICLLL